MELRDELTPIDGVDALVETFTGGATRRVVHPSYQAWSYAQLIRDFICKIVVRGDRSRILYEIENGKIRPSKSLQNAIASMLKGNREFIMIDEQKVAYEEILRLSRQCQKDFRKLLPI